MSAPTESAPSRTIDPRRAVRSAAGRLRSAGPRARLLVGGVLVVLLLACAAAAVVLALLTHRAAQTDQARGEILDVARADVEQLLTYRASDLDADLARSRGLVAPEFEAEFDRLASQLITPATKQNQLQTVATVLRAGVVSAGPDRGEVLVFLRQTTSRGGQPPSTTSSRATVTLTRVDGRWLVAGLSPA